MEKKKQRIRGLIDIYKEQNGANFYLVSLSPKTYGLIDLDYNKNIVKKGSLDYLLWFLEGLLYIDNSI